jgi:hypothetical protein
MKLSQAIECVKTIFESNLKKQQGYNVVPLLRGFSGVGKTECFQGVAEHFGLPLTVIHLSQMSDVGDLMGLIEIIDDVESGGKVSKFIPPNFLPRKSPTLFLLDEFNQARQDVRKAAFEFLLNFRLGSYVAPEGSLMGAAENPDTSDYQTVRFENAAMSARFCILKVDADINDWAKFAYKNDNKFNPSLVSFMVENPEFFKYSKMESFENHDVCLTFRSIEMISQIEKINPPEEVLFNILTGFGGVVFASKYIESKKNKKLDITVYDLLSDFSRVKESVKEMKEKGMGALQGKFCDQIFDLIVKNKDFKKEECKNLLEFFLSIDKEISFNFARKCITSKDISLEGTNLKDIIFSSKRLEKFYSYKK